MHKGFKIGLGLIALVVLVFAALWVWSLNEFPCGIGESCPEEEPSYSSREVGLSFKQPAGSPPSERLAVEDSVSYDLDAPKAGTDGSNSQTTERLIIKTADLSLVVKDVSEGVKVIGDLALKSQGFIVSSNIYKNGLVPSGEITIRIPSAKFDEDLNNVKGVGEVKSQRINGEDVTEQYVDLNSRLRNLQATESQFLKIMTQATKITDILAVQRELTRVQEGIEVIQGQMKYLRQSADLSSITVHLSTDPSSLPTFEDEDSWKPLAVVKAATRGLTAIGKALVNVLIWLVIFIPLWILITLVIWGITKIMKRRSANRI